MENQNTQILAEKIALLLQSETQSADNSLQLSIEKINQRLDKIELNIFSKDQKPKTKNQRPNHFSQEKFNNLEELADEIIAGMETEKACLYEPTGKPCDHCSMCSSFGY